MDANGQRFWIWADEADFTRAGSATHWDRARRVLTLASLRAPGTLATDRIAARARADGPAGTIDPWDTFARVTDERTRIVAGGVADGEVEIWSGSIVRDLVLAPSGVLLAAIEPAPGVRDIMFIDRRNRFAPARLSDAAFAPDRLAAGAGGPVWALDRAARRIALIEGEPLPSLMENQAHAPDVFRPAPENAIPPRYVFPPVTLPPDREIVAIAADDTGRALLLLWPANGDAEVLVVTVNGAGRILRLAGIVAPFTLGWLGADAFAVATVGAREAIPFVLPAEGEMPPDGKLAADGARRPLIGWHDTRFLSGRADPCAYFSGPPAGPPRARRLHALSLPQFAANARVPGRIVDSGTHGFVWHRLYLEAALAQGTATCVWLGAADEEAALSAVELHPHSFGSRNAAGPEGTALPYPSEIPFHPGLSGCDSARLHTVLIQQAGAEKRPLAGRYLRVELELTGNGQAAPLIYALRAWGPRFSYRDHYLPELYRDSAPGADFLERFLSLFESVLTPLEDQVADSWRLTRPGTTPADALDWLASWVGLGLDAGLSEPQKRRLIREATALWRWRGTLNGLQRMLDVVTDNGVRRGELVVVEHFRLRRTFSTILGADLAPSEDPLTRGTAVSGNSLIGPTFYLGEAERTEFFALFRPELLDDPLTARDERALASAAVATLLEQYANRITVLVHGEAGDDRFNLIRRTVERECPAHVEPRVMRARRPLIVGLSSLLAVDSFLRPRPPRPDTREEIARFGQVFLTDTASLDPRHEGGHA